VSYRPAFPAGYSPGIGLVGCGAIAQKAHLPAYGKYGVDVAGVYDPAREATDGLRDRFPFVRRVYSSLDELLADDAIEIVDVATRPDIRPELIRRAAAAGKHVLAQKPLAPDLATAQRLVDEAERAGILLAVNQNARWAPPWRQATLLVDQGAIGDVVAVTHLLDKPLPPLVGTHFDELDHALLYDHMIHWVDISRCWVRDGEVASVRAEEHRTPGQPPEARNAWAASISILWESGASAEIRYPGDVQTARPGALFWIHGTEGTIRGSVLLGSDFLELDRGSSVREDPLEGEWYPDGFAGALAELLAAVHERREPFHSARDNLQTLALTFAACRSAEQGAAAVRPEPA
jgi:predicted dehydrogenase